MKRLLLTIIAGLVSMQGAQAAKQAARPVDDKPNIIVIFTDDQGFADLSVQGQVDDIKTPHIDRLAAEGVRMTAGYITAPQCTPSRAGIITGRYQQRCGVDRNGMGPMPLDVVTIPQRLQKAGYTTGMIGKWHLEPTPVDDAWIWKHLPDANHKAGGRSPIPFPMIERYYPGNRGFTEFFKGEMNRYWINYDLAGRDRARGGEWQDFKGYRLDIQTEAALSFIRRNRANPFFLYLAYFAPHVPLAATEKYLSRFPGEMPERRRHCLAMMSAIDDGTGRILDALKQHGIDRNTLIFFISDNGAPLKIDMKDIPISFPGGAWDGSLNTPWVGEKGMLSEGGIRVPYIMHWPGRLPAKKVYERPVTSLDVGATAVSLAGLPADPRLDGVDLIPFLDGTKGDAAPHLDLFWRFWDQSAIRSDRWKLLIAGKRKFLFDLESKEHERRNLIGEHPELARHLETRLHAWTDELKYPGMPPKELNSQEAGWFRHYFPNE